MFTRLSALLTLTVMLLIFGAATVSAQVPAEPPDSSATDFSVLSPELQVKHVFIIVEENHSYSEIIGNPNMPYLNSLAKTYAVAPRYYANTHPSIGNYFMLTTGQIITNDNNYTQTVTVDNVVRELLAAGKTWKEYSEALPYQGYDGGNTGEYLELINPLSYMSDVRYDPVQRMNLVPFTQFAIDIANHALPNYGFIVPTLRHDGHDGTLAEADYWLRTNVGPLLASPDFNMPGGGLLIITFDESEDSDKQFGGGHVAWVAIGPNVTRGRAPSLRLYQHESTCRFMLELTGVTVFPGAAAAAPDMTEFLLGH